MARPIRPVGLGSCPIWLSTAHPRSSDRVPGTRAGAWSGHLRGCRAGGVGGACWGRHLRLHAEGLTVYFPNPIFSRQEGGKGPMKKAMDGRGASVRATEGEALAEPLPKGDIFGQNGRREAFLTKRGLCTKPFIPKMGFRRAGDEVPAKL